MKALTAQQLAPMMDGTLIQGDPDRVVTGVSTDTRTITADQAFFALQGEKSDGHSYLGKALGAGCRVAVVSKDVSLPEDTAVIRVADTLKALQAPLLIIAKNAGYEGTVIVDKVMHSKPGIGFDAYKGEYVDMVENGIIDPVKVTRCALENATSVAATLLTTEAVVAIKKEPQPAAPAAPDMGY